MRKVILALSLSFFAASAAFSQAVDDYKKAEFYIGYSNQQVDTGLDADDFGEFDEFVNERETFHGFEVAGVYNFSRYLGLKGDVSGAYNKKEFAFTIPTDIGTTAVAFDTDSSLYNFLGGIQVKDNSSDARFKPFGHALVGVGHGRIKFKNVICEPAGDISCQALAAEDTISETGFAGAFGGGIDVKLSDKFDLRAIQVDYNPIRFDSGTQHNVRFGIGIVFK